MPNSDITALLGGWEGYRISQANRIEGGEAGSPVLCLELIPNRSHPAICNGCGRQVSQIHETVVRWVRDLPAFDAETKLKVHRRRVRCPACGPRLERLSWLDRHSRVTRRLAQSVARLCHYLSVKQVAKFFHMSWDQVKGIDKAYLEQQVGPVDLKGVKVIAMDEFAIQKGHRYATVIIEPNRKQVLWVGRGRSREKIRPFFELLGEEGRKQLQAVAMDMNGAYAEEVRAQCPQAKIVYDLFHVVAKYGREVVDRVRVDEANSLKEDQKARKIVKGSRWLLLRNRQNIRKEEDRIRLDELLAANQNLMTVYVLKDELKELWKFKSPWKAWRFWKHWYRQAQESQIASLMRFAEKLRPYLRGILSHCIWPLHTSLLEGINNKIKVIKRVAYGFRDDQYFFLKIRAAFPGNP